MSTIKRHCFTHTGERPYSCSFCSARFSQLSNMKYHMTARHAHHFKYHCDRCRKGFVTSNDLQKHMFTHTGEKPHRCDDCGRAFNRLSGLLDHRRTHTGERLFSCDVCEKAFTVNSSLTRHKRIHIGEGAKVSTVQ